jgi:hypothetical protein
MCAAKTISIEVTLGCDEPSNNFDYKCDERDEIGAFSHGDRRKAYLK